MRRLFDDAYRLAIKPACTEAGAYAERVDEQIFSESIMERIYNQIAKCDFVVADMTGRNPNVFYEVGYAHALGKTVILLTRDVDDIPFDLRHYPHIVYGGRLVDLKAELHARVTFFVRELSSVSALSPVQIDVQDVSLLRGHELVPVDPENMRTIDLAVRVRNESRNLNNTVECQLVLVTPREYDLVQFEPGDFTDTIRLDDGRMAHLHPSTLRILPRSWQSISFQFSSSVDYGIGVTELGYAIRVSTPRWSGEFPFGIRVVPEYWRT